VFELVICRVSVSEFMVHDKESRFIKRAARPCCDQGNSGGYNISSALRVCGCWRNVLCGGRDSMLGGQFGNKFSYAVV